MFKDNFKAVILGIFLFAVFLAGLVELDATTLTSAVQISVKADQFASSSLTTAKDELAYTLNKSFENGTGTSKADLVYSGQRTLSSGSSENLDLAGGFTDRFGNTITFAKIKMILVVNLTATSTFTLGNAGSDDWGMGLSPATSTMTVKPSGAVCLVAPAAGYTVTAGSGDILKVAVDALGTATYNIFILGSSS